MAYSLDAKERLLGVPREGLARFGAVSAETAADMAVGAREGLDATYGLSLTGVAGPDEQEGKPVGTVFAGLAAPDGVTTRPLRLPGDRPRVRTYAVVAALDALRRRLASG